MAYIDETGLAEVTTKLKTYIDNKAGGLDIVTESDVNFYDYDGTLIASYTKTAFLTQSALPANPSHTGLIAQGWNWSLADAQAYVTNHGKLKIGQMYKTASGLTEFDIELTKVTGLTVSFAMTGIVDWGDGNTETINSSTSHTYADYGKYTITSTGTSVPGYVFATSVDFCTDVRVGENVTSINANAFKEVWSLKSITVPINVQISIYAFLGCYPLTTIVIPTGNTYVGSYTFQYCYSLTNIILPNNITSIGYGAFDYCYSLKEIVLPDTTTSIDGTSFRYCYTLKEVIFGNNTLTIDGFRQCVETKLYDFSNNASVPTLSSSSTFDGINKLCKIVVPDSLYSTWIAASNWVTYADYIYKASEVNL